ncbi:MAG: FAD:protein FMN transferase [Candidatus Dormibacteraeota bacterium]|nr:FAD:protein FMN transferase [Candidatus Dormibacteraeota bacterium]
MSVTPRSWRALGSNVLLVVTHAEAAEPAALAVREVLAAVDATYSRFRPDSELSLLNAQAGRRMRVSPLLAQAIGEALRGSRLSGGAVDPTVGRAIRRIGYERDFSLIAEQRGPLKLTAERIPGWQLVKLNPISRLLSMPMGVELDLGSTGKALAADLGAAEAMKAAGRGGVLLSLGGDIAVAGEPPKGGWRVLVAEDSTVPPDGEGQTIRITSGGLATSSITVRRWQRGSEEMHHIVDPATGLPARAAWRTVTVAAATCVDANIAAIAAVVRGEQALEWLEATGLDARLVALDGRVAYGGRWPVELDSGSVEPAREVGEHLEGRKPK